MPAEGCLALAEEDDWIQLQGTDVPLHFSKVLR